MPRDEQITARRESLYAQRKKQCEILQAMKTYGMIVADNGSPWYFTGATDKCWNDTHLSALNTLTSNDFEIVKMETITTK